jgi:hypothetical protein
MSHDNVCLLIEEGDGADFSDELNLTNKLLFAIPYFDKAVLVARHDHAMYHERVTACDLVLMIICLIRL